MILFVSVPPQSGPSIVKSQTTSPTQPSPATPSFPITFCVNGANGTLTAKADNTDISTGDTILQGKKIEFTATSDQGFRIKEWKQNNTVISINNNNTSIQSHSVLNLNSPENITVEFERVPQPTVPSTVTFNVKGTNGNLTANVDGTDIVSGDGVPDGKKIIFTASPSFGYKVRRWKRNNISTGNNLVYIIPSLSASESVTVEFKKLIPKKKVITVFVGVAVIVVCIVAVVKWIGVRDNSIVLSPSFAPAVTISPLQDGEAQPKRVEPVNPPLTVNKTLPVRVNTPPAQNPEPRQAIQESASTQSVPSKIVYPQESIEVRSPQDQTTVNNTTLAMTHFDQGKKYIEEKKYDMAIFEFNEAIKLTPDYSTAYNNLGAVYMMIGNFDMAFESFEAAFHIDPNNTNARQNMENVRHLIER
jgi:hypothetical protein